MLIVLHILSALCNVVFNSFQHDFNLHVLLFIRRLCRLLPKATGKCSLSLVCLANCVLFPSFYVFVFLANKMMMMMMRCNRCSTPSFNVLGCKRRCLG